MNTYQKLCSSYLLLGVLFPAISAQDAANHSLHFGEPNGRLIIKAASLPPPWTAEMWVRRRDAPGPSAPLFIGPAGALKLEQFNSERQVGLTIFGDSDLFFDYQAPGGQWVHLAFVASDDGTALLVNGALVDSFWETLPLPLEYFGSSPVIPGDQLAGDIDELRVWSLARSEQEIAANFRRSLTGDEAGLVGYWRCDSVTSGWTPNTAAANWIGAGVVTGATLQVEGARLQPGFALSRRDLAVPENGRALVGVHLDAPPVAPVAARIGKLGGDPDLTVNANTGLIFTASNWQDDQLVEVRASADDDAVDGVATFSIDGAGATSGKFTARELDNDLATPVRLEMSMVPAVRLEGPSPSLCTVEFSGEAGRPGSWQFLTNIVLSSGGAWLADWKGVGDAHRFYRAAFQPFRPQTNMVYVPPGEFTMGSPLDEADHSDAELAHRVFITRGFWMGRFEVTQDEFYQIVGTRPSANPGGNLPVEKVTWQDATNFCGRLTVQEQLAGRLPRGWAYRLPTEAEWEYACRAGSQAPFGFGPDLRSGMANVDGRAEYRSPGGTFENPAGVRLGHTIAVGSYAPNAWGLYDMHGNVMEWCLDGESLYAAQTTTDPLAPAANSQRAARGGSFYFWARFARSAFRVWRTYYGSLDDLGFRVVLAPAEPGAGN